MVRKTKVCRHFLTSQSRVNTKSDSNEAKLRLRRRVFSRA